MTQGKRVELSAAQQTEVWCRWKAGQSLHECPARRLSALWLVLVLRKAGNLEKTIR